MAIDDSGDDGGEQANESSRFPDPRLADSDGLVAVGGRLDPDWLLDAYSRGVFPWPTGDRDPLLWWSPDPRAVIPLDGLYLSRRLRRTLRSDRFHVTIDTAFDAVTEGCATGAGREDGTWLTLAMRRAYGRLHRLGHAHSVEVWRDELEQPEQPDRPRGPWLAGGLYGVSLGGLFAAESMFHRMTDASKVALAWLVAHLERRGYGMLDVQQWTPHTGRMGAITIERGAYLGRLAELRDLPVTFGEEIRPGCW